MPEKFDIQDRLYQFPYHYIPHFSPPGVPRISRVLSWGIEYLTYMTIVKETVEKLPGKSVLDIGCGDGFLLNSLNKPEAKLLGVDVSERPVLFAKAFSTRAEFRVQDIFDMEGSFDIVVLTEVMEHIPDDLIQRFMNQAKRLVAPGGHLVITVPTTVVPLNNKHYRHYDEELLDRDYGSSDGWKIVAEKRLYRQTACLEKALRLTCNKFWTVNSRAVWRALWKWHRKKNLVTDSQTGRHLMRLYEAG